MADLAMKAGELSSDRFSDKTEQIKAEASERLVKYFIDVMCTIINAKENGQISARQGHAKMVGLYEIAREKLSDSELHHLTVIDGLLSRTQALMKIIYSSDSDSSFNIYNDALNDNIELPSLGEAWTAVREHYKNFIIIPGAMELDEIVARAPDFLQINIEDLREDEYRQTVERPKGFYTLALAANENAIEDYPNGSRGSIYYAEKKMREFKQEKNLNLSGLTIKEYIWSQLFHIQKMAKLRTDPTKWGLDYECASFLLNDYVGRKDGQTYPAVGLWFQSPMDPPVKPSISIGNSSKGIKNFLPIVPRLAINFSGEKND